MIQNIAALMLVVAQATAPDPLIEAALNILRASIAEAKALRAHCLHHRQIKNAWSTWGLSTKPLDKV